MTEQEWLDCGDPTRMQQFLDGKVSERKARLYRSACSRHIWELLIDPRSRTSVEVAERYADSQASPEELHQARIAAGQVVEENSVYDVPFTAYLATEDHSSLLRVAETAANHAGGWLYPYSVILHCIFSNPFRPSPSIPSGLTSTVVSLAEGISTPSGTFDRLPILSDALQDAGCEHEDILNHLRGPGPHCRGCCVVDLLFGKS